ncbi:hypothetical protein INR49_019920 [Caranx melampygus]|nr:hypothetical protein INR49_019920 [Caranx melampygus]
MEMSAVLLVCILVTHAGVFSQVPELCDICKEALRHVRQEAGPNASSDVLNKKLDTACNVIVDEETMCKNFIRKYRKELLKELETNNDVDKICERSKACHATGPSHINVCPSNKDAQNHPNDFP